MVHIGNSWDQLLAGEFQKEYYLQLREFLKQEYTHHIVYPDMYDIFNALKYTPYEKVKVVILGQDPYHEPGQAHGLSFSVKKGILIPPSLRNIYKELHDDIGFQIPSHGYLEHWAKQGVLLLNTVLTVQQHNAGSHRGKGWEMLTDEIIRLLNNRQEPMVFILWGANARSKKALITNKNHLILEAPHPSPLSAHRGFFGGKYFSRANAFLREPIDWQIPE